MIRKSQYVYILKTYRVVDLSATDPTIRIANIARKVAFYKIYRSKVSLTIFIILLPIKSVSFNIP